MLGSQMAEIPWWSRHATGVLCIHQIVTFSNPNIGIEYGSKFLLFEFKTELSLSVNVKYNCSGNKKHGYRESIMK